MEWFSFGLLAQSISCQVSCPSRLIAARGGTVLERRRGARQRTFGERERGRLPLDRVAARAAPWRDRRRRPRARTARRSARARARRRGPPPSARAHSRSASWRDRDCAARPAPGSAQARLPMNSAFTTIWFHCASLNSSRGKGLAWATASNTGCMAERTPSAARRTRSFVRRIERQTTQQGDLLADLPVHHQPVEASSERRLIAVEARQQKRMRAA